MILSFAFVYEYESSIDGYKGPTMYKGEHESSICGYKGPTMYKGEHESSICGYKVQPCFDLGLLGTLGQVWVSLGTSQVHSIWFCVSLGTSQVHNIWFVLSMCLFGL